jgi:hypothetical protein
MCKVPCLTSFWLLMRMYLYLTHSTLRNAASNMPLKTISDRPITLARHGYADQYSKNKISRSEVRASKNTMETTIFRDVTPCSPVRVSTIGQILPDYTASHPASLTYSSTLNMVVRPPQNVNKVLPEYTGSNLTQ